MNHKSSDMNAYCNFRTENATFGALLLFFFLFGVSCQSSEEEDLVLRKVYYGSFETKGQHYTKWEVKDFYELVKDTCAVVFRSDSVFFSSSYFHGSRAIEELPTGSYWGSIKGSNAQFRISYFISEDSFYYSSNWKGYTGWVVHKFIEKP